jgi:hypothetical protein
LNFDIRWRFFNGKTHEEMFRMTFASLSPPEMRRKVLPSQGRI